MDEEKFDEWYPQAKVYFDGSHYIAIPHTTNLSRRRKPHPEEIVVRQTGGKYELVKTPKIELEEIDEKSPWDDEQATVEEFIKPSPNEAQNAKEAAVCGNQPIRRKVTRKQIFEELYQKYLDLKKSEKIAAICRDMRPLFKTDVGAESFVNSNYDRKCRNLIARRVRFVRKALNQEFNYFVTFTYDDKKHDEDSFKKKLRHTLGHLAHRKGWKYMGVWERGKKTNRLHFHGIFHIPDGTMPGMMMEVNDYSFSTRKRQITRQNSYFNERFGRSDFETIEDKQMLGGAIAYIVKYLEKTGEKIVYSKGLPQFFVSDIMEEDVACPFGLEDKKLLLFDDFVCWDEGVSMGKVSKQTIAQMPKAN